MKSTVKLLLSVLALGVMTSLPVLRAQDADENAPPPPPPPEGHRPGGGGGRGFMNPEKRIEMLDKALSLTADQKAKIKDIFAKTRADLEAVPREERREKMRDAMKAQHDQIRAILTPEQQAKFDDMPPPGRRGGPGGPGGGWKKDE